MTDELVVLLADREAVGEASAVGHIVEEDGGYTLLLDVQVAEGREQRTLHAADCALLTRAGALVIAVSVDALATASVLERARVDGAPEAPALVPALNPAVVVPQEQFEPGPEHRSITSSEPALGRADVATQEPTRWPLAISMAAHGGFGGGLVPGLGGGLEGELGFRFGPLSLRTAGYHWFARTTELEPDAGVRVALSGAWLRGGYVWSVGRIDVPLTLAVDVAAMHGAGAGARVDAVAVRDAWVGVSGGPGVEVWLGPRFALTARVDGILGVARPAMFLGPAESPREAYRMPNAGVRLMVGGRLRFWETNPPSGGAR